MTEIGDGEEQRMDSRIQRMRRAWILGSRFAFSVVLAGGLLAAVIVLAVGCSEMSRYRVLSFFFDGVPPPPGVVSKEPKTIIGPWGVELSEDDPRAKEYLRRAATRPAREQKERERSFVHAPYGRSLCGECHDQQDSYKVGAPAGTCRKCHQPYYEPQADDWAHGPVALGRCALCHVSHESKHDGLLTQAVPEVCFSCHDAARTLAGPYHATASERPCGDCHDPHFAGNRMLLIDSGSYQRRGPGRKLLPAKHVGWDKKTCTGCHLPERSNQLVENVDAKCLACHQDVRRQDGARPLHTPVREGKCLGCHTAHKSSRPALIRPAAEKLCLDCHALDEIATETHPDIRRGDFLLCHAGHSSPREHLLNALGQTTRAPNGTSGSVPRRRGP